MIKKFCLVIALLFFASCGKQGKEVTKETVINVPVESNLVYYMDRDQTCELLFTVEIDGQKDTTCLDEQVKKSVNLTPNIITQLNTVVYIEDKADRVVAFNIWKNLIK
jgi:hypothetical protein